MNAAIVIIGYPRTGSSYLCHLLKSFPELKVYSELFHFDSKVVIKHLGKDWKKFNLIVERDWSSAEEYFGSYKTFPIRFLEAVAKFHSHRNLVFKLFPEHLPDAEISSILEKNAAIYLIRDIFDSYISNEIAVVTGKYGGVDTSNIRARFDLKNFYAFCDVIKHHFQIADIACREFSVPSVLYRYEDLFAHDILRRLKSDIEVGLKQPVFAPHILDNAPTKQDYRESLLDKVSNPDEVVQIINEIRAEVEWEGRYSTVNNFISFLDKIMTLNFHRVY